MLQGTDCISDELQRKYLNFIWNRQEGIYYISEFSLTHQICLEDKRFTMGLNALEVLSGFSLFTELAEKHIIPHLIKEIERLMTNEVILPPARPVTGHYSESWRGKDARKNDLILRILRIIKKTV